MHVIANVGLFKIGWLSCVYGAASGFALEGCILALFIVAFSIKQASNKHAELLTLALITLVGVIWESLVASQHLMVYATQSNTQPEGWALDGLVLAPYWLIVMWALFATTINQSMAWLKDKLIIAAPDAGGSKRANAYAKYLDVDLALCYKQRKKANEIESMTIIGDVEGKDVVIIDDMIDTAGTLTKSAQLFIDHGAKSVSACCTHALLSGPAHERIENSVLKELVVTNTIPLKRKNKKIKVLSVANLFSDVMEQHVNLKSISKHFLFAN